MSDLLRSTLGGTIRLEAALDADVPLAMTDPTQLELIILNLAINARDAMPTGGVISIQTSTAAAARTDRPEEPPAGEYVVVAVADTGTGMTEEVRARAFEPFFTTKEIGKGSGLGLPQVLGVAKQLGGGIRIQTEPGRGTRVEVYLPYAKSQEPEVLDPAVTAAPPKLSGVRVLLVDDDPDVRAVAAAMLADLGCKVSESASGAAGIDVLKHGGIDVVVIDYAMPGMNGVDAARAMSRDQPHVPILLVTGYADPEALAKSWTGRVLRKPFDIEGLAAEIGHCIGGRLNVVRLRRM
jgi:CheY-like chemotaxis protein